MVRNKDDLTNKDDSKNNDDLKNKDDCEKFKFFDLNLYDAIHTLSFLEICDNKLYKLIVKLRLF